MNEKLMERATRLNKILKEKGAPFQVEHVQKFKNNMCLDGYVLISDVDDASPVIYYDESWWNKSDVDVVFHLIAFFDENACKIDVSSVLSSDYIRSNIRPKLLSVSNSPNLQEYDIAFIPFLDMVVTFYIPVGFELNGEQQEGSAQVTCSLLDKFNISLDDAYTCAVHNIEDYIEIRSISSILPVQPSCGVANDLMVIRTSLDDYGASSVLSEKTFQQISEKMEGNIAFLPSSIHEFLAFPYASEHDLENFREMVVTINQVELPIQDVLTGNVYVLKDGKFTNVF